MDASQYQLESLDDIQDAGPPQLKPADIPLTGRHFILPRLVIWLYLALGRAIVKILHEWWADPSDLISYKGLI